MSVTIYSLCGAEILAVQAETLNGADLSGTNLRRANLSGANLSGANLNGANLSGADLWEANLSGANLWEANLYEADLWEANLSGANLWRANLYEADLRRANLRGTDLRRADLRRANLWEANLSGADLRRADLSGAIGAETAITCTRILPEGDLVVYKKASEGAIVTLKIPAKAKRSHEFGRKCRAEYAKVLRIQRGTEDLDSAASMFNPYFVYRVGDTVRPDSYEEDWTVECGPGIHFYITREEAELHE